MWKKFGSEKKFVCEKKLKKICVQEKFCVRKKLLGVKTFLAYKNLGPKKISSKEVWSKSILVHKNYNPKKLGSKKFGQNRTSYSWDIANLDKKCHQGICCLDICQIDSWLTKSDGSSDCLDQISASKYV